MSSITEKLEFDKKRSRVKYCPCGKSNRDGKFVPYKGFESKGYCHSCDRTFLPEQQRNDQAKYRPVTRKIKPSNDRFHSIPVEVLSGSLNNCTESKLAKWLISLYGKDTVVDLLIRYKVGTSNLWEGATTFWQVDQEGRVRTGKIMLYNPSTGRRVKEPHSYISWEHVSFKKAGFCLKQCLFGEHLLSLDTTSPVAIVESEKTALIASLYMPQFIWLATGGKIGCKWYMPETGKVLSRRTVYLFPDLSENGEVFMLWQDQAKDASLNMPGTRFIVSDYLERNTTDQEKYAGLDLADYLIKYDLINYQNEQNKVTKEYDRAQDKKKNEKNIITTPDFALDGILKSPIINEEKPFLVFDHYERDVWYSQGKKVENE